MDCLRGMGRAYLKLIHHRVWRTQNGNLLDVTPSDELRNLFLPDSIHNVGSGIPARYIALDPSPEVGEAISFCEELERMEKENLRRLTAAAYRGIRIDFASKHKPIKSSDGSSIVGRNDPCLCGSGKKFKKCCLS